MSIFNTFYDHGILPKYTLAFGTLFKDMLLTLEDEENIHFYDVGVVEHEIFIKNLT